MSYQASPIRGLDTFSYRQTVERNPYKVDVQRNSYKVETQSNLNLMIIQKNAQIKRLYQENNITKKSYEDQAEAYRKTIQSLQRQLSQIQKSKGTQFILIKEKFQQLNLKQSQSLKSVHSHQVQFLLREIAQQRAANETQLTKLALKDQQLKTLKQSYQRQLSANSVQINSLNKLVYNLQQEKNKEIKDITSKRELQRSRTSGLISSRKQNSTFMDKQIKKLNEEVLQKTIQIQSLNRQINREKKKAEDNLRIHNKKVDDLIKQHEDILKNKDSEYMKMESMLKSQLLQFKQKELTYLDEIDSLKNEVRIKQKEVSSLKQSISARQDQIFQLKAHMEKLKQTHANQLTNLMKQRRRRSSNLGSSRSLTSSLKDSGLISDSPNTPSHSQQLPKLDSNFLQSAKLDGLHPIKQESPNRDNKDYSRQLANSNLDDEGIQQNELARALYYYDNLVQQLKKSHSSQVQLLQINQNKLRSRLQEKQHELLDILTRFSPLVKIHAQQKSIEQDRKQRIQKHWKADVALLEVLLRKYKIKTFS